MSFDYKNLQPNGEQVEINRLVTSKMKNKPTQDVEIFSAILYGKDTSKYGKKVDEVMNTVKDMASAAVDGDYKAKAELNAIRTVTIQQPLMARLSINDVMGNVTKVGLNEELRYEIYQLQGEMSREQASSGAFPFPTVKKDTKVMETKTATGGIIVDYRELASGATDGMAMANEQVITDITNQMVLSNISALRTGIINATTMKNYAEGITKTNVEKVRGKARRFGNVTILGDYNPINKLGDLTNFAINSGATEFRFPEYVMEEIMKTGLIKNYKGTVVVEIPNTYNMTKLNTAGDFYAPYLPTTDLYFVPAGSIYSPLQIGIRAGLQSMTATDLNLRAEVTRYDVEYGNAFIASYAPALGLIADPTLAE
jgi:hypothetical protein